MLLSRPKTLFSPFFPSRDVLVWATLPKQMFVCLSSAVKIPRAKKTRQQALLEWLVRFFVGRDKTLV